MASELMQTMADARVDARSLSEFVSKDANFMVSRRLAPTIYTLDYYLKAIQDTLKSTGYVIAGSFADGGSITKPMQVLSAADGKLYRWGGSLPKSVPSGSTPQNSGGFGNLAWVEVSDSAIRSELKTNTGASLVGYSYINHNYPEGTVGAEISSLIAHNSRFNQDYVTPIANNLKFEVSKGAYSWWNEPQSISVGDVHTKTIVGCVDTTRERGWSKSVHIHESKKIPDVEVAYLINKDRQIPDAHNASVTTIANDHIVTFYSGHFDLPYIPYRVSKDLTMEGLGEEKRIDSPAGNQSYCQAFHTSHGGADGTLCVFFRSNINKSWFIARSSNWFADVPDWTVEELFNDSEQMYVRVIPSHNNNIFRLLATKNARYEAINGLWFGYIDLQLNRVRTVGGVSLGAIGERTYQVEELGKIYSTEGRIRLYDASSYSVSVVNILVSTDFGIDGNPSGPYRFLQYSVLDWALKKDIEIVESGVHLGSNYYFGGAHFSHNSLGMGKYPLADTQNVFVAREEGGTWYVEEYAPNNSNLTAVTAFNLVRVIDESDTHKLWRPRVPFNSFLNNNEGKIEVTWCKGTWKSYRNYDASVWALRKESI